MSASASYDMNAIQACIQFPGPGVDLLSQLGGHYLEHCPIEAANTLLALPSNIAAEAIKHCPVETLSRLWKLMSVDKTRKLLSTLEPESSAQLLQKMHFSEMLPALQSLAPHAQTPVIKALPQDVADSFKELLQYPENTAGAMMSSEFEVFFQEQTVGDILSYFRCAQTKPHPDIYLLDSQGTLSMHCELSALVIAPESTLIHTLAEPVATFVRPMTTRSEVLRQLNQHHKKSIPVIDSEQRLLGIIHSTEFTTSLPNELPFILVGGKDEHALATSRFAVRRRQAWLQMNLLTVFLSAMVVAFFEKPTLQISAMALLMSLASGQASSAGAQALAVTMRSLALREITVKHWRKIAVKEAKAGLLNGLAVAVTAALGVLFWLHSIPLAGIIAIVLLLSMGVSAAVGSLVPLCLKHFKQDPAHSAAIILSTLTNIIGLLIFLAVTHAVLGHHFIQ